MRVNKEARAAAARQRRAETRERLLDAAVELIAEHDPESVSIEQFAAAAGVSRGTFYNYFPTVPDLVHALTSRLAGEVEARFDVGRLDADDPASALAAVIHSIWAAFVADPIKGWVGSRLESAGVARQATWEALFHAIHARGVATGRFRAADAAAARHLTFGAFRMALRDLYVGLVGPEHGVELVALLLIAYGVPPDEAQAISRREAEAARASGSGE